MVGVVWMTAKINDLSLITELEKFIGKIGKYGPIFEGVKHPLDDDIRELLGKIKPISGTEFTYQVVPTIDVLWQTLLDKSIKCLRYFDVREPFQKIPGKVPVSYGLENVVKYYNQYSEFESVLYGSTSNYRDHILHSIRTWMLGVYCLLHTENAPLINKMTIEGENGDFSEQISFYEKISMWTIIALCHDLGYPLEKSQEIFDKTRKMMGVLVANPRMWADISFSGIQDTINNFIVNFMSSKMKKTQNTIEAEETVAKEAKAVAATATATATAAVKKEYHGRVQPKYYLKFTKSLENYRHGIISAIIIYKMLVYFIEADFNLNEDYIFSEDDAKQFYIRRDILRAIAAHTCTDVYHVSITTFPSLLMICDELQEWGRKSWKDLYLGTSPESKGLQIESFDQENISVTEHVKLTNDDDDMEPVVDSLARIYTKQYDLYRTIFRDGQATSQRTFGFKKSLTIELDNGSATIRKIIVNYSLDATEAQFDIDLSHYPEEDRKPLTEKILKKMIKELPKHLSNNVTVTFPERQSSGETSIIRYSCQNESILSRPIEV